MMGFHNYTQFFKPDESDSGANLELLAGSGQSYRGEQNVTTEGLECDRWDKKDYYRELFFSFKYENYPDDGLDGNFCRNPGGF